MESEKIISENKTGNKKLTTTTDELANLKRISEVDNFVEHRFDDLIIRSANEGHIKELGELWANHACVQQIFAPDRYDFKAEGRNWQIFVSKKLLKQNNLLLVAQKDKEYEVRGFLYLQTVTIPSSDLLLKGVIEDIYTKPQYRNQGIAMKMLEVALDWVSKQNIKQVDLISLGSTKGVSSFCSNALSKTKSNVSLNLLII